MKGEVAFYVGCQTGAINMCCIWSLVRLMKIFVGL